MVPLDPFTVVQDACTLFSMLKRDVLLTLAGHEFFDPKWSARIRAEWMRNLSQRHNERSPDGAHPEGALRVTTWAKSRVGVTLADGLAAAQSGANAVARAAVIEALACGEISAAQERTVESEVGM